MKAWKLLSILATLGVVAGTAARANAGTIFYDYTTTLSLASGTDALGLNGAVVDVKVDVDSSSVYITRFGYPAVIMNNDATVTITGSSNAANNATFALPQLAFYPSFAGLFTDPAGLAAQVTLPIGGVLNLQINTNETATGSAEIAGNTVNVLDFGPATSEALQLSDNNNAVYNQVNPTVTATLSAVPEPATLGLALASLVGLGLARRFKIR
jgi:hypothetical protein